MFSNRLPDDLRPSRLAAARAQRGPIPYDLTETNPTRCGLPYPAALLSSLGRQQSLPYRPHPFGPAEARRAVAATFARWSTTVDESRVVLTASTSEAYSFLFKLLADPGDTVLVPTPSYPLFEPLARLDGVLPEPFRLDPSDDWRVDLTSINGATAATRALVMVHPNNPTGSYVHPEDADRLTGLCAARGWALIADEVFLPYPLRPAPGSERTFAATSSCLTFTLGGLSKSAGLPQLKLAWIVVSGPDELVGEALDRLAHIADAYLSVSTPVALAAAELINAGAPIRAAISRRCAANLEALQGLVASAPPVSLLAPAGGWSAVLRVPAVVDDEQLALRLLEQRGVLVFPGFFFDLPADGHLVLSLLPPEQVFAEGVRRLLEGVCVGL